MTALLTIVAGVVSVLGASWWFANVTKTLISWLIFLVLVAVGVALVGDGFGFWTLVREG